MDDFDAIAYQCRHNAANHPGARKHADDEEDIDGDRRLAHLMFDALFYIAPPHAAASHAEHYADRRGRQQGYLRRAAQGIAAEDGDGECEQHYQGEKGDGAEPRWGIGGLRWKSGGYFIRGLRHGILIASLEPAFRAFEIVAHSRLSLSVSLLCQSVFMKIIRQIYEQRMSAPTCCGFFHTNKALQHRKLSIPVVRMCR